MTFREQFEQMLLEAAKLGFPMQKVMALTRFRRENRDPWLTTCFRCHTPFVGSKWKDEQGGGRQECEACVETSHL
jgi:cytochrome c553